MHGAMAPKNADRDLYWRTFYEYRGNFDRNGNFCCSVHRDGIRHDGKNNATQVHNYPHCLSTALCAVVTGARLPPIRQQTDAWRKQRAISGFADRSNLGCTFWKQRV